MRCLLTKHLNLALLLREHAVSPGVVLMDSVAVLACLAPWAYTPSGALFGSSMSPPLSTTCTPGPKVRVRVTLALTLQRPLEDEPT